MDLSAELIALNWPLVRAIARGAGFAALVPSFGLGGVRPRVLLAVLLSLVVNAANSVTRTPPGHDNTVQALLVELAIGLALGFTLRVMLSAARTVALLVEQQIGFTRFDDGDVEHASALGRLYAMIAVTLFFCTSGHRAVVAALLRVPDAAEIYASNAMMWTELFERLVTAAWYLVLQSALPLIVSLLGTHIAAGMIARVVPQFGASAVAPPVQVVVGLVLVLVSIASVSISLGHGFAWATNVMRGP